MNDYKYLACGLSEKDYRETKFTFCETLQEAFKACVNNVIEHFGFYRNMEDDILEKGKLKFLNPNIDAIKNTMGNGMVFSYKEK